MSAVSPASSLLTAFLLDAFQNTCSLIPVWGHFFWKECSYWLPTRISLRCRWSVAPPGNWPWTQSFSILTVAWDIPKELSGARARRHCAHRFLPLLQTAASLVFPGLRTASREGCEGDLSRAGWREAFPVLKGGKYVC